MSSYWRVCKVIDALNEKIGTIVSWGTGILVLMVFLDTFLRYLFSKTFVAVQELEWHLFSVIFLFGAAYTLKHNAHVRVDFIYHRLSRRAKALINCIGCLVFLFPGCFLVIYATVPFVEASWAIGEASPDPGGLPARWLLKAALPFGFSLIALQGISLFVENLLVFLRITTGKEEA